LFDFDFSNSNLNFQNQIMTEPAIYIINDIDSARIKIEDGRKTNQINITNCTNCYIVLRRKINIISLNDCKNCTIEIYEDVPTIKLFSVQDTTVFVMSPVNQMHIYYCSNIMIRGTHASKIIYDMRSNMDLKAVIDSKVYTLPSNIFDKRTVRFANTSTTSTTTSENS